MTELRQLLVDAVALRVRPGDAIRALGRFAQCSFDTNPAFVKFAKQTTEVVTVEPGHLSNVLRDYLSGRLSEKELRDWCLFVTLVPQYEAPKAADGDASRFDLLWGTIHDLAAPEVHGPINPDSVREKLVRLGGHGGGRDDVNWAVGRLGDTLF